MYHAAHAVLFRGKNTTIFCEGVLHPSLRNLLPPEMQLSDPISSFEKRRETEGENHGDELLKNHEEPLEPRNELFTCCELPPM